MLAEPFQYVVIRAVPRVEREEFVNVGVVLFCRTRHFLGARARLDPDRLAALDPDADADAIAGSLHALVRVADGDPQSGPLAALPPSERFGWIAAPASTVLQRSQIHSGLCIDPQGCLEHLFARLVG
jgi:hypothetical protein